MGDVGGVDLNKREVVEQIVLARWAVLWVLLGEGRR